MNIGKNIIFWDRFYVWMADYEVLDKQKMSISAHCVVAGFNFKVKKVRQDMK